MDKQPAEAFQIPGPVAQITRAECLAWLEALRSGKFVQGVGALCHVSVHVSASEGSRRYCCLGVMAPIVGAEELPSEFPIPQSHSYSAHFKFKGHDVGLPNMPPEGLLPEVDGFGPAASWLARMNDDKQASFSEIADWIEEHLLPLLKEAEPCKS